MISSNMNLLFLDNFDQSYDETVTTKSYYSIRVAALTKIKQCSVSSKYQCPVKVISEV